MSLSQSAHGTDYSRMGKSTIKIPTYIQRQLLKTENIYFEIYHLVLNKSFN